MWGRWGGGCGGDPGGTLLMTSPLIIPGHSPACDRGHRCPEAVVKVGARWFITFGHCGFNAGPNNRKGYATPEGARTAILKHQRPEFTAKAERLA